MIISKLYGGLGNQLFQYALGKHLAVKNKTDLKFDITALENMNPDITYRKYELHNFNISAFVASAKEIETIKRDHLKGIRKSIYWRLQYRKPYYKQNYIKEKAFVFDSNILSASDNVYLDGYWQSPLYFNNIRDILLEELMPVQTLIESENMYLLEILNKASVSIHLRRGDYITNFKNKEVYLEIPIGYYNEAIRFIEQKIDNPVFFIFSDDNNWVKNNFNLKNCIFVEEINPVKSMFLMSNCKHNIIANSTFSWWGAWLNNNNNKIVVSPAHWFAKNSGLTSASLMPDTWIKL